MYVCSSSYDEKIKQNSRRWKHTGIIRTRFGKVYEFDDRDIVKGSAYLHQDCSNNQELTLGTVYASEFGISLFSRIPHYQLYQAQVEFTAHLHLGGEAYEAVPMGVFTIHEANRRQKIIELSAYDHMMKFENPFRMKLSSGTVYELLELACQTCEVPLAQDQAWFEGQPNGQVVLGIYADHEMETYRDFIGYLAQVLGCFTTINRQGALEFRKYHQTVQRSFLAQECFETSFSDFVSSYTAVSSTNLRTQTAEYYALEKDTGLTLNLGINPFLQLGLKGHRQQLLENILSDVSAIHYLPFESDVAIDPRLELGDVLTFPDFQGYGQQMSCITSIQFNFQDKMRLKGLGKNPLLASAKSKNDKNITGLLNQVEQGKIATYSFINAERHLIQQERIRIARIEFATRGETDAHFMGSLLLNVTCQEQDKQVVGTMILPTTESSSDAIPPQTVTWTVKESIPSQVKVTYVFNDTEIKSYYPTETYLSGPHVLSLYYPLNHLESNKLNTFTVYLEADLGSIVVDSGQFIASISGQGLSAQESWDGKLEMMESVEGINWQQNHPNQSFDGRMSIKQPPQQKKGYQERLDLIPFVGLTLSSYEESLDLEQHET